MTHPTRRRSPFPSRSPISALAALAALALAACSGGDDDDDTLFPFQVKSTSFAAVPNSEVVVEGQRLLFLAEEADFGAGTDLDGDAVADDQVVVAVNLGTQDGQPKVLAAATAYVLVGDYAYLAGFEAGTTVLSLLAFDLSQATPTLVKLDEIDPASAEPLVRAGDRVFWVAASPAAPVGETGLRFVDPAAPETVETVLAEDMASTWQPSVLGAEGDLVLLALDETVESADLNGDGVSGDDATVLALADGLGVPPVVRNVELALFGPTSPLSVHVLPTDERRVAFLVDEAAQGASLNDASLPDFGSSWESGVCVSGDDVDQADEVLHWLLFETWDTGLSDVVNTGLAGSDRVLQVDGFLATLLDEADQGPGGCDYSGDGLPDDVVLRWIADDTAAVVPENSNSLQRAVVAKPGGSFGATTIGQAFVIVTNETQTVPTVGSATEDWVATHRPAGAVNSWRFLHGNSDSPLSPSWLAPEAVAGRIGIGLREAPFTVSFNEQPCGFGPVKDTDTLDSVPTWPSYDAAADKLTFPGGPYAVDPTNSGVTVAKNVAYFRVSEAGEGVDYTGDGNQDDFVLFRQGVANCPGVAMSALNDDFGLAIETDGVYGAGFLSDEGQTNGVDLNGDGDSNDRVLRWFRF